MSSIEELYRQKGEIITQIELAQSRLNVINQAIAEVLNKRPQGNGAMEEAPVPELREPPQLTGQ